MAPDVELCCLFCSSQYAYLSATILKEVAGLNGDYTAWTQPHCPPGVAAQVRP
ncbi:MAG: hypothetical protein R2838_13140 [Caldilineaceae bacterium]